MASRWSILWAAVIFAALTHLWFNQIQIGSVSELLAIIRQQGLFSSEAFEVVALREVTLPRLTMALLVGATLACCGSLFQQLTQNRMISPLTLGTSSGAWLGLVLLNLIAPGLVAGYSLITAMLGALFAMGIVISIVGIRNLNGLPVILAGMAINLLLGAIATAIILLNDRYAENLFIWGAGDLGQNGWQQVIWLMPKLLPIVAILLLAPRVLTLLSIGSDAARARGLNLGATFALLFCAGIWLVSASITSVGVISFIALIAPNIARYLGFIKSGQELYASSVLGAALLCFTDTIATVLGQWSLDMIPTGTATALIGAPALIIIARKQIQAQDQLFFTLPKGAEQISKWTYPVMTTSAVALIVLTLLSQPSSDSGYFVLPDQFEWSLKYPRIVTAIFAGAGLSVAGVVLQRLVYNPLASPDILGVSAGAVLALIAGSLFMGHSIHQASPWLAITGSTITLAILLLLGRKHRFAPSMLILTGISLTAILDALVQFSLTRMGDEKYQLLSWLSGSTYRADANSALTLAVAITLCITVALLLSRWVTLIATGHQFAVARGLNLPVAYALLLSVVAVLCATVTTTMGPVAFVGLLAPHIAVMLGARLVKQQITMSVFLGAILMLFADWLGQTLVYPAQLSAGTLVSVIGGSYFIYLLLRARTGNEA